MHRVIAARQPLMRMEAALSAMRAHTTRPKPCRTPTFAPLQSDGRWHLPWTVCFSKISAVTTTIALIRLAAADQHELNFYPNHATTSFKETYRVAASAGGI